MELTRKQLVKAAKEMNEVMGLDDPAIDTSLSEEKLKAQMTEAIGLINDEEDEFSEPTQAVITALIEAKAPAKAKKAKKEEPEEEPEEEEGDEEEEPEDEDEEEPAEDEDDNEEEDEPEKKEEDEDKPLPELVAGASKLSRLKEIVGEHDEFKKLRKKLGDFAGLEGTRKLKNAMFEALGVEPPKRVYTPKQPTRSLEAMAYKRAYSIIDTLSKYSGKKVQIENLVKEAAELFAEKAEKGVNIRETAWHFSTIGPALGRINAINLGEDEVSIPKTFKVSK